MPPRLIPLSLREDPRLNPPPPPKRGRGRPRINPRKEPSGRGPGRPRKNPPKQPSGRRPGRPRRNTGPQVIDLTRDSSPPNPPPRQPQREFVDLTAEDERPNKRPRVDFVDLTHDDGRDALIRHERRLVNDNSLDMTNIPKGKRSQRKRPRLPSPPPLVPSQIDEMPMPQPMTSDRDPSVPSVMQPGGTDAQARDYIARMRDIRGRKLGDSSYVIPRGVNVTEAGNMSMGGQPNYFGDALGPELLRDTGTKRIARADTSKPFRRSNVPNGPSVDSNSIPMRPIPRTSPGLKPLRERADDFRKAGNTRAEIDARNASLAFYTNKINDQTAQFNRTLKNIKEMDRRNISKGGGLLGRFNPMNMFRK